MPNEYANAIKSSIYAAIFAWSNLSSANMGLSNLLNVLGSEHKPLGKQLSLYSFPYKLNFKNLWYSAKMEIE